MRASDSTYRQLLFPQRAMALLSVTAAAERHPPATPYYDPFTWDNTVAWQPPAPTGHRRAPNLPVL